MTAQPAQPIITQKPKLALVKIGNRSISGVGFSLELAEQHLLDHQTKNPLEWCNVAHLAGVMYGRATPIGQRAIRRQSAHIFKALLHKGTLLSREYERTRNGKPGKLKAMKLYTPSEAPGASIEYTYLQEQLFTMLKFKQLKEEQYQRARMLLDATPASTEAAVQGEDAEPTHETP